MARAKSANGSVFVVARYYPAGNNLNSFDGNVLSKVGWSMMFGKLRETL